MGQQTSCSVPQATMSKGGTFVLTLMRVAIGWHFLYEGLVKLFDPDWSAGGYLQGSTGPLAESFRSLAADPTAMKVVDQLNIWGLLLIGGCLMLGFLTRFAALCGVALLALYYVAYPPLFQTTGGGMVEGHYLVVSKNLVELIALLVVIALPARPLGLDGILSARRERKRSGAPKAAASTAPRREAAPSIEPGPLSRRRVLAGLAGLPFVGALVIAVLKRHGWPSYEAQQLAWRADAYSGATIKKFDFSMSLKDLKGQIPHHHIGKVELSRVILGGNLMGGWAHARDLIYVDKLVKAYHNRNKIFETFRLAEACGINTILTNPVLCEVINDYWRSGVGKIQFVSDCGGGKDILEGIQRSIDNGACACYIHGGMADSFVANGKFDPIEKGLELIRKNGLPAGIGGHKLQTVKGCVEKGIKPDFWMKTLHRTAYWSAGTEKEHDNIWCREPEETVALMKDLPQPWIAFKTLAAGALRPSDQFSYAFTSGADFICVGMYDFQIIEDANIALEVLAGKIERQRPWTA